MMMVLHRREYKATSRKGCIVPFSVAVVVVVVDDEIITGGSVGVGTLTSEKQGSNLFTSCPLSIHAHIS